MSAESPADRDGAAGGGDPSGDPAPPGPGRGAPGALVDFVGSSTLALVLVAALALLVLAGSLLPQEGVLGAATVEKWTRDRPRLGSIAGSLGLFHVFRTPAFLGLVACLALNTAVCTVLRFVREGGLEGVRRGGVSRRTGFYVLHVGLVLVMAGGVRSYALELEGLVYLTEGQVFREAAEPAFRDLEAGRTAACASCGLGRGVHTAYARLREAPLRPPGHAGFEIRLEKVTVTLVDGRHRVDVASRLSVMEGGRAVREGVARFNEPFEHGGFSFVQQQTGYAPRIWVRRKGQSAPLGAAFLTLTTDEGPGLRRFHDVLPLDYLPGTTVATLLPTFDREGGAARCTGEDLTKPLMVFESLDAGGATTARAEAPEGEWVALGDFEFRFTDIRRWSSFLVSHDPGYGTLLLALWICVAGMVLRYSPDLARWLASGGGPGPGAEGGAS